LCGHPELWNHRELQRVASAWERWAHAPTHAITLRGGGLQLNPHQAFLHRRVDVQSEFCAGGVTAGCASVGLFVIGYGFQRRVGSGERGATIGVVVDAVSNVIGAAGEGQHQEAVWFAGCGPKKQAAQRQAKQVGHGVHLVNGPSA